MADNVVRLATTNERPRQKACTDCKHFHPDTNGFGYEGWKFMGFGPGTKPSALAIQFAMCSATGGHYASAERATTCQGRNWE